MMTMSPPSNAISHTLERCTDGTERALITPRAGRPSLAARDVPVRGLRLGADGGLSWCPGPRLVGHAFAENEVFRKAALDPSRRLQLRPYLVPAAAPAAGTLLGQAPCRAQLQARGG